MRQSRLFPFPLLLFLIACNRQSLEQAIAPDPRLTTAPNTTATPSQTPAPTTPKPTTAAATPTPKPGLGGYTDLDSTPKQLRSYLNELLQLKLLPLKFCKPSLCSTFKPNQPIQRRTYARWLVTTNNRFYLGASTMQIRLATTTAQPAFKDLPNTDADFAIIQGLAEAGILPSRLSNDKAPQVFKPNDPLTRTDLILWKAPLDLRRLPPDASVKEIKQDIGFKDAPKMSPALRNALLSDHQNGNNAGFRRAFGYTTIFQPQRPVTRAEAAAVVWHFGTSSSPISAQSVLNPVSDFAPTPEAAASTSPTPSPTSSPQ
ncbi:S-layer homology domain-containing protein [filamentous cyanobacterium LEGE 11480]|uniref:S-layer homology domain-containing protein n=1 Tax=Romeriopsis navalis LEGE 11480 TaxID=2777977 RepID=A0A928VP57_9CYAN|nr:S-layer homology domain-containing protein [Romeriopsis navalis]MBE9032121.1 S-layer homology domain-containing protein [Romeriopsis navalis LEGE 11480]